MKVLCMSLVVLGLLCGFPADSIAGEKERGGEMARVGAGMYRPFYPPTPQETSIRVDAFFMDKAPVTNAQYREFVKVSPQWRRGHVKGSFADERYLKHWKGDADFAEGDSLKPVTSVSWFAAREYCRWKGLRLPTENEWEYAAQASEMASDARQDMAWRNRVLDWYARPAPKSLPQVKEGKPNFWGIHDLHGLVWEWVEDFNSSLISGDNRENAESPDKNRFCGAGAQFATEKEDYASFMRLAFRTSLKARYTTSNLGFRCASD